MSTTKATDNSLFSDPALRILTQDYALVEKKDVTGWGHTQVSKLEISVDEDLPDNIKKEVVIHEIVEALNFHLELRLKHHQLVGVAAGMYQVMRDNPAFIYKILD